MYCLDSFDADTRRPKKKATVKSNIDLTKPVRRQRQANRKRADKLDTSLGKKRRRWMVAFYSVLVLVGAASSSSRDTEILNRLEQLESQVTQMKASLTKLRRQQVVARRKVRRLTNRECLGCSFSVYSHWN